jgi:hypothetical protein
MKDIAIIRKVRNRKAHLKIWVTGFSNMAKPVSHFNNPRDSLQDRAGVSSGVFIVFLEMR